MAHTKEPWKLVSGVSTSEVISGTGRLIADVVTDDPVIGGANGLRIVACVNALEGLNPEGVKDVVKALEVVLSTTISDVDGRDMLAELHPRNMLDVRRRADGVETWHEADWLSDLNRALVIARDALATVREP